MPALTTTHRDRVTEDQIDHLGHMNVRYYGENARAGGERLVTELGPPPGLVLEPVDLYARHHREQLLGAELEVRSGVVGVGPGTLRLYHELRNHDTDELAATFVHLLQARSAEAPAADWPAATGLETIAIPPHGRPRSLDLDADPIASSPTLALVHQRELAIRRPRAVTREECGPDGWVRATDAPMLVWGGEPLHSSMGPTLHETADGARIGWASMETRLVVHRLPRAGDRIQSFGATVAIADKVTQQALWAYDLDREDLLVSFEVVNLAFDTVGRRAISIPADLLEQHGQRFHPDLRATSV